MFSVRPLRGNCMPSASPPGRRTTAANWMPDGLLLRGVSAKPSFSDCLMSCPGIQSNKRDNRAGAAHTHPWLRRYVLLFRCTYGGTALRGIPSRLFRSPEHPVPRGVSVHWGGCFSGKWSGDGRVPPFAAGHWALRSMQAQEGCRFSRGHFPDAANCALWIRLLRSISSVPAPSACPTPCGMSACQMDWSMREPTAALLPTFLRWRCGETLPETLWPPAGISQPKVHLLFIRTRSRKR